MEKREKIEEYISKLPKEIKGKLQQSLQPSEKLKKKAEKYTKKLYENNPNMSDSLSNIETNTKSFDINFDILKSKIDMIQKDNKYFSIKYNKHHQRTVNIFQKQNRINYEPVDFIFQDLVQQYYDKNYKIEKISGMDNIFSPSVLLLEEAKLHELFKDRITSDIKDMCDKEFNYILKLKKLSEKDRTLLDEVRLNTVNKNKSNQSKHKFTNTSELNPLKNNTTASFNNNTTNTIKSNNTNNSIRRNENSNYFFEENNNNISNSNYKIYRNISTLECKEGIINKSKFEKEGSFSKNNKSEILEISKKTNTVNSIIKDGSRIITKSKKNNSNNSNVSRTNKENDLISNHNSNEDNNDHLTTIQSNNTKNPTNLTYTSKENRTTNDNNKIENNGNSNNKIIVVNNNNERESNYDNILEKESNRHYNVSSKASFSSIKKELTKLTKNKKHKVKLMFKDNKTVLDQSLGITKIPKFKNSGFFSKNYSIDINNSNNTQNLENKSNNNDFDTLRIPLSSKSKGKTISKLLILNYCYYFIILVSKTKQKRFSTFKDNIKEHSATNIINLNNNIANNLNNQEKLNYKVLFKHTSKENTSSINTNNINLNNNKLEGNYLDDDLNIISPTFIHTKSLSILNNSSKNNRNRQNNNNSIINLTGNSMDENKSHFRKHSTLASKKSEIIAKQKKDKNNKWLGDVQLSKSMFKVNKGSNSSIIYNNNTELTDKNNHNNKNNFISNNINTANNTNNTNNTYNYAALNTEYTTHTNFTNITENNNPENNIDSNNNIDKSRLAHIYNIRKITESSIHNKERKFSINTNSINSAKSTYMKTHKNSFRYNLNSNNNNNNSNLIHILNNNIDNTNISNSVSNNISNVVSPYISYKTPKLKENITLFNKNKQHLNLNLNMKKINETHNNYNSKNNYGVIHTAKEIKTKSKLFGFYNNKGSKGSIGSNNHNELYNNLVTINNSLDSIINNNDNEDNDKRNVKVNENDIDNNEISFNTLNTINTHNTITANNINNSINTINTEEINNLNNTINIATDMNNIIKNEVINDSNINSNYDNKTTLTMKNKIHLKSKNPFSNLNINTKISKINDLNTSMYPRSNIKTDLYSGNKISGRNNNQTLTPFALNNTRRLKSFNNKNYFIKTTKNKKINNCDYINVRNNDVSDNASAVVSGVNNNTYFNFENSDTQNNLNNSNVHSNINNSGNNSIHKISKPINSYQISPFIMNNNNNNNSTYNNNSNSNIPYINTDLIYSEANTIQKNSNSNITNHMIFKPVNKDITTKKGLLDYITMKISLKDYDTANQLFEEYNKQYLNIEGLFDILNKKTAPRDLLEAVTNYKTKSLKFPVNKKYLDFNHEINGKNLNLIK